MKKEDLNKYTISIFNNSGLNLFNTIINEKLRTLITKVTTNIYNACDNKKIGKTFRVVGGSVGNIFYDIKNIQNDNLVDINALSSIVYKYENDGKKRPAKHWFFTDEKKDWSIDTCSDFINTILQVDNTIVSTYSIAINDNKYKYYPANSKIDSDTLSIYFDLYGLTNNNTVDFINIKSKWNSNNNPVYINGSNIVSASLDSDDVLFINTSKDYIDKIFINHGDFSNNNDIHSTITDLSINDQTELINTEKIQNLTINTGDALAINYGKISNITITDNGTGAPKIINHNQIGVISKAPALELINAGTISSVTLSDEKWTGVRSYN